jgi:hypothetical protein
LPEVYTSILDSYYFSDWCAYSNRLDHLPPGEDGQTRAAALLQASFTLRPPWIERLKVPARIARAWARQ